VGGYIEIHFIEISCGQHSPGSEYGPLVCSCEHGNEPLDFMKGGLLDQMSYYQLLKKYLCSMELVVSQKHLLLSRVIYKNLKIKICKTIILLVVLYGCETSSLTLKRIN
jgi:hypothetical protein